MIDEAVVLLDVPWTPDPEVWRRAVRMAQGSWRIGDVAWCASDVEERDARELRGEPPSMEGWTIFGEGGA